MAHAGTPTKCEGQNCGGSVLTFQETSATIGLISMFKCNRCGFQGYYIPESLLDGSYPDGLPKSKAIPDSKFLRSELALLADLATIGLKSAGDSKGVNYLSGETLAKAHSVVQKLARRLEWEP